ncbi:MAG: hypothetical protein EXX96DRAFT_573847 [Benjaminiella poitrasii]|nr:MAG: hypothetical protein EXX96DRAFT_573847 [Benjaminiella poitrasii]
MYLLLLFINVLRYLLLSLSFIGLSCHFVQCKLLSIYEDKMEIQGWLAAGHWQYILWYIVFSLSLLCSLVICIHATCCKRAYVLRGDKCFGIINIFTATAAIIVHTFFAGQEPWTNGLVEFKEPTRGFIAHCHLLDQHHDVTFPLLFQRCLLIDTTFVLSGLICLLWIILVTCILLMHPIKKVASINRLSNEEWEVSSSRKKRNEHFNIDPSLSVYHQNLPAEAFQYNQKEEGRFYWQNAKPIAHPQSLSRHYISSPQPPGAWVYTNDQYPHHY